MIFPSIPFVTGCTETQEKTFECTKCNAFFLLNPMLEMIICAENGILECAVCPDCVLELMYDGSLYDGSFMDLVQ